MVEEGGVNLMWKYAVEKKRRKKTKTKEREMKERLFE
jgi:hypothetical protein